MRAFWGGVYSSERLTVARAATRTQMAATRQSSPGGEHKGHNHSCAPHCKAG